MAINKGNRPEFLQRGISHAMQYGAPPEIVQTLRIAYLNELMYEQEQKENNEPNKIHDICQTKKTD